MTSTASPILTMEMFLVHADGREVRLDEKTLQSGGVFVGAGGGIVQGRVVEHRSPFPVGSIVMLTPENVEGLFFSIMNAIQSLQGGLVNRVEALNAQAGGQQQG